jgi:hypothetical protein
MEVPCEKEAPNGGLKKRNPKELARGWRSV